LAENSIQPVKKSCFCNPQKFYFGGLSRKTGQLKKVSYWKKVVLKTG